MAQAFLVGRILQCNFEVFTLANICDSRKAQQFYRVLYSFTLRIKNARLETDVDFRFHIGWHAPGLLVHTKT